MNISRIMSSKNQQPRGTILLCVLVCLALMIAFVTNNTKAALRARRQMSLQLQHAQAELLLEAGIQRATRLLATNSEFEGETWQPSFEPLPEGDAGTVEIRISRTDNEDPFVSVTARLIKNASPTVQLTYQFKAENL